MKITVVCDVLGSDNNGTTIAAKNLINSLKKKGHVVNVICPDPDKSGIENYYIVKTINLGIFNGYVSKNGVSLAKRDDDIIEKAIKDVDIVHIMVPFSLGRRAEQLAHSGGIPVSAGFHAMAENFTTHIFMKNARGINRLTYTYFAGLYKHCDAIHYPTRFLRELYEGMYGKTNGYVISNGVNSIFTPKEVEKPPALQNKFVILFTGRFSREKSHKVLIDGVFLSKHSKDIQLIFAGSGPCLTNVTKYAEKLLNPPIIGFFTRQQMVELTNYSDLYVHPAEIEAEGIACLEAITCGLVPVISDSPRCATKEYAIDDKNLFTYNSPANLAEKIDWWIEHPEEKKARSLEYIEFSKGRFDQEKCMDEMEKMLFETSCSYKNKVSGKAT